MRRKIQPLKFLSNEFLTNTSAVQLSARRPEEDTSVEHLRVLLLLQVVVLGHRKLW